MADRVKIVDRIARRGRRLLEKRNERRDAALAKQIVIETALAAQKLAKREADIAEFEAWQARPPNGRSKPRPSATREQRKIRRDARAQERLFKMQAKEAIQAAKREMAAIKRRASRLPPLPYSKAPPLPY